MSIKKIELHAGQLDFTDLSVMPNFSAGIQKLEGSVLGLSSKPGSRAKIDLRGSVDTFSPVTIAGEVDALSSKLYTDVALTFRNIQLAVFNPYSGKFAGYDITRGKLSTEFRYKVDGRKLDAQHHIVIDQLEFGDRTGSKDAVSLPVKLAVSLLKDRNGTISLDLPVSGSLDDPQFRLAPLVWKVLVNVMEKAVTAPFALLGELFGGGPDLQFVDFRPGVATLEGAAVDKVKTVAKALLERPQLKLEIPIATVPEVDRPALISASVDARLNAVDSGKKPAGRGSGTTAGAAPADFSQLDPAGKLDRLTQVYADQLGSAPKFPDVVTAIKAKPELVAAKVDFLTKALREHAVVSDVDLQALAQQRALNVQKALLEGTDISPERVFVVVNDKGARKEDGVRLELALQ